MSKRFGAKVVLEGFSCAVAAGEVVAVTGENGSGKSTLLKLCAGLLAPDRGTIDVAGRVGYCPQVPGLLGRLTIDEHLALFAAGRSLPSAHGVARGRALLEGLGVSATKNRRIATLGGGTQQKVNLALALLDDPNVLLLDEPYQGFDHGTYLDFWGLVAAWREEGKAVLVITHLLAELSRADRVIDLSNRSRRPER